MTARLFVYGPLCHPALREAVLGADVVVSGASVSGNRIGVAADADWPVLVPGEGRVEGLLLDGLDAAALARAEAFAQGVGCEAATLDVQRPGLAPEPTRSFVCVDAKAEDLGPWDLASWAAASGALWTIAAREILNAPAAANAEAQARRWPMAKLRAASRLRAATGAPAELRADYTARRDVELRRERTPYTEYFSLEDHDLRFRRFDGGWSPVVRRAGFIGGDAATVLPYDPGLDAVLVVEQFRAGPYLRGDPRPWMLEPIAGRIDPGETPQDTVRREAMEETGLEIGALHPIADYYPSPGAVAEFVYSFVGLADLDGRGGVVGGEASEDEDIHAHVLPFDRLMALVASGEAGTGPLILSAYWLSLNRDRMRG